MSALLIFSFSERLIISVPELERLAVDTLSLRGVRFVSRDSYLIESAIVFVAAVMGALVNAAFNAVIGAFEFKIVFFHFSSSDNFRAVPDNIIFTTQKIIPS